MGGNPRDDAQAHGVRPGPPPSLTEAVVAVDAMLAARLVSRATLATLIRDEPYWPGLPQLRKMLLLCDPGAESPMESRLRLT